MGRHRFIDKFEQDPRNDLQQHQNKGCTPEPPGEGERHGLLGYRGGSKMEDKVSKEESLASPFCLGREWVGENRDPDATN